MDTRPRRRQVRVRRWAPDLTSSDRGRCRLVVGLGGLISGILVFSLAPEAEGHGTDAAIAAVHHNPRGIRARVSFVKIIASAITIGSGGSAGREGPTAQISAGFGSMLARWLDLDTVGREDRGDGRDRLGDRSDLPRSARRRRPRRGGPVPGRRRGGRARSRRSSPPSSGSRSSGRWMGSTRSSQRRAAITSITRPSSSTTP